MKRSQPPKNQGMDSDSKPKPNLVSSQKNPKRSRGTENNDESLRSKKPKSADAQAANSNKTHVRIQQPRVLVNTKLMKVKMECDYVPIKTETDQEVQDDKNGQEKGQENSAPGSVESRNSNSSSSSAQNVDENNHGFQGLNCESGQQKQQQKQQKQQHQQKQQQQKQQNDEQQQKQQNDEQQQKQQKNEQQQKQQNDEQQQKQQKNEQQQKQQNDEQQQKQQKNEQQQKQQNDEQQQKQQKNEQQQKQQLVVAEVETGKEDEVVAAENDAVNTNTRELQAENAEKERVGKLEEEIKEYAQKVLSLSREKTEIQMTLQNKNDQLKQLNEQKQTNNLALNSIITVQWTEMNQLKAKVAEQQQQIVELKTKLESGGNIQQSAENSNPNPNVVQTKDLPTRVLSRIFDYLDINSLKESRLVCRRWKTEAGKILLSNFYVVSDDEGRCENTLVNWLRNSHSIPKSTEKTTAFKLISKDGQQTLQLLTKFPELSSSIHELKHLLSDTETLHKILQLLPNLQVLDTKPLDLIWSVYRERHYPIEFITESPLKFQQLINKLETLKKLKLDICIENAVKKSFLDCCRELLRIKSLEIHVTCTSYSRKFMEPPFHNWPITSFTLDVPINYDVKLIRSFLQRTSLSLQHLKFRVKSVKNDSLSWSLPTSSFEPWTDDWLIPMGLNRLETLGIEQSVGREGFVLKCIVAVLQLPRLKKLSVDFIPVELAEIIHNWNSHESSNGRKLQSQSLEELEILPSFLMLTTSLFLFECHQIQSKIPRDPWPLLKSLKYPWNSPKPFDASFLSELTVLERLELKMWGWNPENINVKTQYNTLNSNKFRLRDLKNLKGFCLIFPENDQRSQDFANFVVLNELKFMRSLQCVYFHGVVIDAEPLKSALGPNVPIIFTD